VIFWSAVGSGAPHRFSSAKRLSAWEKRRRRCALPAQSKKVDKKMSQKDSLVRRVIEANKISTKNKT